MQKLASYNGQPFPSDTLLAQVIRSAPKDVLPLVDSLSDTHRAQLAVFCNARAHLREHGRKIAESCSYFSLTSEGGQAGALLFEQSRTGHVAVGPEARRPLVRPVTLARPARPDTGSSLDA